MRERQRERRGSNFAFLNFAKLILARLREGRGESRKIPVHSGCPYCINPPIFLVQDNPEGLKLGLEKTAALCCRLKSCHSYNLWDSNRILQKARIIFSVN